MSVKRGIPAVASTDLADSSADEGVAWLFAVGTCACAEAKHVAKRTKTTTAVPGFTATSVAERFDFWIVIRRDESGEPGWRYRSPSTPAFKTVRTYAQDERLMASAGCRLGDPSSQTSCNSYPSNDI